jgi:hypothetical protein
VGAFYVRGFGLLIFSRPERSSVQARMKEELQVAMPYLER